MLQLARAHTISREFYVIDVDRARTDFSKAWTCFDRSAADSSEYSQAKDMTLKDQAALLSSRAVYRRTRDGSRYDKALDTLQACLFVHALLGPDAGAAAAQECYARVLDEVNLAFYREFDADKAIINDQIMGRFPPSG